MSEHELTVEEKVEYLDYAQKRWPQYNLIEALGKNSFDVFFRSKDGTIRWIPWF